VGRTVVVVARGRRVVRADLRTSERARHVACTGCSASLPSRTQT
jgi:hypothetical protein